MKGDEIKSEIEIAYEQRRFLHLSCKDGKNYNGWIDYFDTTISTITFVDLKLGTIPILVNEIIKLDSYRGQDGRV